MRNHRNQRHRTLLVEDNEDFRKITANFLIDKFKFEVTIASSGNEAIEFLRNHSTFDLVITDYCMPNGTGKDVLDYMDLHQIYTPTIVFSGGGYDDSLSSHPRLFRIVDKGVGSDLTWTISEILGISNLSDRQKKTKA